MKFLNPLTILIIIPLILSFDLASQTRGLQYKLNNSLDFVFGGDIGFRLISGDTKNGIVATEIENRKEFENYKFNHRFGFNFYQGLSESWSLKTGIRLSNPGFRIFSVSQINIQQDLNTIVKKNDIKGFSYRYKYQFFEIPFGLKYVFARSWCESFLEFGISPSFYTKTIIEETTYEGSSTKRGIEENIKSFNMIGFLSIGGDFAINKSFSGFSQLIARYQVNNLRSGSLKERLIGIGIELGIKKHL